jgi:hypothetical protein
MRPRILLLALLVALIGGQGASAAEVQLYRVRARPAVELAGIVGPLLAPDGTAVADESGGFVLLRGSAEAVAQALETLETLDVTPRQYRIESELASRAALQARGLRVSGWLEVGDLRIGRAARGPARGREPRAPRQRAEGSRALHGEQVEGSVRQLRADSSGRFRASVVALEGSPAEIWTGNVFPVAVRTFEGRHGRRDLTLHETAWVPVRQGLRVQVRGAGDQVELDLVPIVEDGHPASGIREVGASTRLRIRPGEQLVIGSLQRGAAQQFADPLAGESTEEWTDDVLLVRVDPI